MPSFGPWNVTTGRQDRINELVTDDAERNILDNILSYTVRGSVGKQNSHYMYQQLTPILESTDLILVDDKIGFNNLFFCIKSSQKDCGAGYPDIKLFLYASAKTSIYVKSDKLTETLKTNLLKCLTEIIKAGALMIGYNHGSRSQSEMDPKIVNLVGGPHADLAKLYTQGYVAAKENKPIPSLPIPVKSTGFMGLFGKKGGKTRNTKKSRSRKSKKTRKH